MLVCKSSGNTRTIATHSHSHHAAQLSVLQTNVDRQSDAYAQNAKDFEQATQKLRELHEHTARGGSEKARTKHVERGKMLVREYAVLLPS